MTLTEFILARIAEDEAVARAATAGPWEPDGDGCCVYSPEVGIMAQVAVGGGDGTEADVTHIVRNQPARVLAECAALRAVVEWAVTWPLRPSRPSDEAAILRPLAAIWATHPDYRPEEWA